MFRKYSIQELTEHVYYSKECRAVCQCMLIARQNLLLPSSQVIKESKTTLGDVCNCVVRKMQTECRLVLQLLILRNDRVNAIVAAF